MSGDSQSGVGTKADEEKSEKTEKVEQTDGQPSSMVCQL